MDESMIPQEPRKIKFKAWNTTTRLLMRLHSIDCHKGELIKPNHLLLQFCGLTDKEGEEIYDMDVLLIYSDMYVVNWDHGLSGWVYAPLKQLDQRKPFLQEDAIKMKRFCSYLEIQ